MGELVALSQILIGAKKEEGLVPTRAFWIPLFFCSLAWPFPVLAPGKAC